VVVRYAREREMQLFSLWMQEAFRLLGGRRLHPLITQCPICHQSVRLHVNKAGRRHVLEHARALYEGAHFDVHNVANVKCVGSKKLKVFNPRPGEQQRFKLPDSLLSRR
jgi:hypothetical protein